MAMRGTDSQRDMGQATLRANSATAGIPATPGAARTLTVAPDPAALTCEQCGATFGTLIAMIAHTEVRHPRRGLDRERRAG